MNLQDQAKSIRQKLSRVNRSDKEKFSNGELHRGYTGIGIGFSRVAETYGTEVSGFGSEI